MIELNTVVCADCLDVMRDMPDKCIDLVLTDPPYGINIGTSVGGANRSVIIGGERLSRPKYIGALMTEKPLTKNTLKKLSELANIRSYSAETILLNI